MPFNSSFSIQLHVNTFRTVAQCTLYKPVHCPAGCWNALINAGVAWMITVNVTTECLRVATVSVLSSLQRSKFFAKRSEGSCCTVLLWCQYPLSIHHCLLGEEISFRSSLFPDVRQRWRVVSYRRFGTNCRSHFQGSQPICSKFKGHLLSILSRLARN